MSAVATMFKIFNSFVDLLIYRSGIIHYNEDVFGFYICVNYVTFRVEIVETLKYLKI
jgi:hypothetical protein